MQKTYKNQILKDIKRNRVKAVSFDLFDTLVYRMVQEPTDVFVLVGDKATQCGILPYGVTGEDYRNLRCEAEKDARKREESKEIFYEDIFQALPDFIAETKWLSEKEWEIEQEVLYANPVMLEVIVELFEQGYLLVITSDMYFHKEQIIKILEKTGYKKEWFCEILVSSEYKKSKGNGSLYNTLLEQLGVKACEVLHIGDNINADYLMAKRVGMKAILYNIADNRQNREIFYEKMVKGNFLPEIDSMRKYLPIVAGFEDREEQFWYKEGIQNFGPLLTAMVEWTLDVANKENIRKIYPLMREGKLFGKMLCYAAKQRNMDVEIAELYISRKAVFIPSITEINIEDLENIFRAPKNTLHHVMNTLGIGEFEEEFRASCENEETIGQAQMIQNLYDFMQQEKVKYVFHKFVEYKTACAVGYFKQMGLTDPFITVDIGAHGTIQQGLERTIRKAGIYNHNVHLLTFCVKTTAAKVLGNLDIRGYVGSYGRNNDTCEYISRHPALLEEALMCEEGSTKGYLLNENGRYEPILGEVKETFKTQRRKTSILQQGVCDFQKEYLRVEKTNPYIRETEKRPEQLAYVYQRLETMPSGTEAQYWGQLFHDDNFGRDVIYPLCRKESIDDIIRLGEENYLKSEKAAEEAWIPGVLVNAKPQREFSNVSRFITTRIEKGMAGLAQCALENKYSSVIIIGAGEAGRTLKMFLDIVGIRVEAFIDNNKKLQGTKIEGIPIGRMQDQYTCDCYVIASMAFAEKLLLQAMSSLPSGSKVVVWRDSGVFQQKVK